MNKIITPRDGWRYFTQANVIMGILTAVLAGLAITRCLTTCNFEAVDAVTFGCIALLCCIHQFNLGYVDLSRKILKRITMIDRTYVSIGVIFHVKTNRIAYFYWRCYESATFFSKAMGSIDADELEQLLAGRVDDVEEYNTAEIDSTYLSPGDKEYDLVRTYMGKVILVKLNDQVSIDHIPFMDDTECWLIRGYHDKQEFPMPEPPQPQG